MKIGQIVIDLYFNSELGKFYVTAAQEEVQQGSQSTAKVENSTTMFPEEVHLDPDSDTFVEDKAALKQKGYFFNRSSKTWRKKKGSATSNANGSQTQASPTTSVERSATNIQSNWFGDATEIQLSQDDPDFEGKKFSLKSAGFKWNPKAKAWHKSDQ